MSHCLENAQDNSFTYKDKSHQETDTPETQTHSANFRNESIKCEEEVPTSVSDTTFLFAETFQNEGEKPMVSGLKEEPCFYEECDLTHSDISIPMDLKPLLCPMKEEPHPMDIESSTPEIHIQCQSNAVKDEPIAREEGSLQNVVMSTGIDTLHHLIKEEPSDAEMSIPSAHRESQSAAIKEEPISSEGDNTPPLHPFIVTRDGKLKRDKPDPMSSKTTHTCPVCNRVFDSHGNLTRHRETHKGVKMSCLVCGVNFCNKMDLTAHAKEHRLNRVSHGSSKMAHPCPVCKRTFNTHASLGRHREANKGKTMSCKECGADFCNMTDMVAHARIHKVRRALYPPNKLHTCPVCKRIFNGHGNLLKHRENQKGVRFSCLECEAEFCNKTDLTAHVRKHRDDIVVPYSEPDETSSLEPLMVHKTAQTGEKLLTCAHCGKQFTDESDFVQHVNIHTVVREFCCTVCGKSHPREEDLLTHHLQTHEEEQTIICSECGLTFVDQDTLDRHLRFHKLHKPFSCGVCRKQFVHKTELVRHERTHVNWTDFLTKRLDQT